jgi:hypothetical protein
MFYVLHQILEKKLQEIFLNKDLKCGNIFMHLEEPAKTNNKITLR